MRPDLPESTKTIFMEAALRLSRQALPNCRPNPPVGCVIVREGEIVSEGFTGEPGAPHAEAAALAALPASMPRAELAVFVTLEPCSFHGRTPSCAEALVRSGIKTVYVGVLDPDPRNNGAGLRTMRDAGIHVELGVLEHEVLSFMSPYLGQNDA